MINQIGLVSKALISLNYKALISLNSKALISLSSKALISLNYKAIISLNYKALISLNYKALISLNQPEIFYNTSLVTTNSPVTGQTSRAVYFSQQLQFQIASETQLGVHVLFFSQQFQLPKQRFIWHQKAPLSALVFKFSQHFENSQTIVSNSVKMHHLASLVRVFLSSANFINIVSNCTKRRRLAPSI